jgi:hypothetical protein
MIPMYQANRVGPMASGDAFSPASRPATGGSFAPGGDARLFKQWSEAEFTLGVRIDALRVWARGVRSTVARVCLDWCIAGLEDVHDNLSQLRALVTHARASRRIRKDSLIVQYLAEAYVWTGDVLADVNALVRELDGGPAAGGSGSSEDSVAYIVEFLEPLHRQIEGCRTELAADPMLSHVVPLTTHLQSAIVALDWGLRTDG